MNGAPGLEFRIGLLEIESSLYFVRFRYVASPLLRSHFYRSSFDAGGADPSHGLSTTPVRGLPGCHFLCEGVGNLIAHDSLVPRHPPNDQQGVALFVELRGQSDDFSGHVLAWAWGI